MGGGTRPSAERFQTRQGPSLGINNLDYRKQRILSSIFFAVEKDGVLAGSLGYPEFHFECQGTSTGALLVPLDGDRHNPHAKL